MSQKRRLTPRQDQAIQALLSKGSICRAAEAAGVSRRTLTRWLQDAWFRGRYLRARGQMLQEIVAMCHARAASAVERLASEMDNKGGTPTSRISAAREILSVTLGAAAAADFEERLARMEEQLDAKLHASERKKTQSPGPPA